MWNKELTDIDGELSIELRAMGYTEPTLTYEASRATKIKVSYGNHQEMVIALPEGYKTITVEEE